MTVTRRERPPADGLTIGPWRRTARYWSSRLTVAVLVRAYLRIRLEGRHRLPPGPAIYCFNHQSWTDPFMLMASLPMRPRLSFFGPKEEDMSVGGRNRLMVWTGSAIPYKPGKNDLREATRKVAAVIDAGSVVAIAGEGRIHVGEGALLPLNEGAAYFAIRSHVPVVPVAIIGTGWLGFGRRVRIRVGEAMPTEGRPTHEAVEALTERTWTALHDLLADAPDAPEPGRVGSWLTELFNDWPEGSRDASAAQTREAMAAIRAGGSRVAAIERD